MFDIGFSELFVIAVVALIVLGPERLPKAARFAGLWMRRARAQWYSVKSELENELAADELRRSLQQTQDELREAHARVQREGQALHREVMGAAADDDADWHPPAEATRDRDAATADTAPVDAVTPAAAETDARPAPRPDER
ncbi:Sec-independent protein translocase protein TatB [Lysobacter korlensis]|uniref:Sec-independent protein translocase protein TatB n=1 Tax=Lysobacter korlensis TaxID=553636 RepID=A0ABV6RK48_9GAMM